LLGRMGDEDSAESIAPLLSSSNQKLRMEALKSIYKIGGNLRGKILLDALPEADDEFKSAIIEVLGQAKIVEAIPVMINILRQRPLIATASRTVLEEKICMALGAIGDPRAIRTLEKIAEPKSFLRRRTFPDKVKAAAARSLVSLREKLATTDES
ncbi:MAG TPA: HEAT repeat domain-containing protein, partial [Smithellaceae bacterium]|nr:HEAT repeat domain-containing protein [Smithellaceae bacterium]